MRVAPAARPVILFVRKRRAMKHLEMSGGTRDLFEVKEHLRSKLAWHARQYGLRYLHHVRGMGSDLRS